MPQLPLQIEDAMRPENQDVSCGACQDASLVRHLVGSAMAGKASCGQCTSVDFQMNGSGKV